MVPNSKIFYGLCLTSGISTALYIWFFPPNSLKKTKRIFSIKEILSVAKNFEREYFPIYKLIQNQSQSLSKLKIKRRIHPRNSLEEVLEIKEVKQKIAEMEDQIFQKFDIRNKSEFQSQYDKLIESNSDLKRIAERISENAENCAQGKMNIFLPPHKFPKFVSSIKTFHIFSELLVSNLKSLNDLMIRLETENFEINPLDSLQMQRIREEVKSLGAKERILQKFGYNQHKIYHGEQLFDSSLLQMQRSDSIWFEPMARFKSIYQKILERHFYRNIDYLHLKNEICCLENSSKEIVEKYKKMNLTAEDRIQKIISLSSKSRIKEKLMEMSEGWKSKDDLSIISETNASQENNFFERK